MFEKFFPRRSTEKPPLPEPTPMLALGALLVRVALADRNYEVSEVAMIDKILSNSFNLGPIEAAKLRATCEALERDAPGTSEFAKLLREQVIYGERRMFAGAMWRIALADGTCDDSEKAALHEIEAALGITEEDSTALQNAAIGNDSQST